MICKKCNDDKPKTEFYNRDYTCKVCRRAMVKANRERNAEYYREYDKKRYKDDPSVKQRHERYAKSDRGKIAGARAKKKYKEKNPIKRGVHIITGNAIRDGRLTKKPCEVCGTTKNIHAHHDDYAKPLYVRWLCAQHHDDWHKENGDGLNAS